MQTRIAIADIDRAAQFGSYRVLREVGHGSAARVYEAQHVQLGKRVAIKAIAPQRRISAGSLERLTARLLREGRVAVRVAHPHIVSVFDISVDHGTPYLVMEFLPGGTLAELLAERAPLPIADLVELFMPLVAALAHAHDLGVVHRDIKPDNCLLGEDSDGRPSPKLADFGVCRAMDEVAAVLTQDDGLLGTLRYMAPEQFRCARTAGPAADQYSFAVMIYQAATGELPLVETDPVLLMRRAAGGEPLLSESLAAALPQPLQPLLVRALAADEAQRFPSMHALGAALLAHGNARTRNRWLQWCSEKASDEESSISAIRKRGLLDQTWSDDAHSVLEPARSGGAAPSAPKSSRLWLRLLALASVIIACCLVATRVSQAPRAQPAAPGPALAPVIDRPLPAAPVSAVVPAGAGVLVQAPSSSSRNAAPDIAPSQRTPQRSRTVRHAEPTPIPERSANEQRAVTTNELQMGRNGAPILD